MTALLIGTALAVASLCYVLYPLFRASAGTTTPLPRPASMDHHGSAVEALRELEFDRQTGKISDADYAPLKARYTDQAVAAMRAGKGEGDQACPNCGRRPESDALFCSNCGAALPV